MSIDLEYFRAINDDHDDTSYKENQLYYLHDVIDSNFNRNIDYYKGELNEKDCDFLIIDKQNSHIQKEVKTKSHVPLNLGDIVHVYNTRYMIIEVDANRDKLNQGLAEQVNYNLKWIEKSDSKDILCSSYCIMGNATQYNSGEYDGKQMTVGTSQQQVMLPSNQHTNRIKRSQRFLIGKAIDNMIAYRVSTVDHVTLNYGEKGIVKLMLEEDTIDRNKDNLELGIADYYNNKNIDPISPAPSKYQVELVSPDQVTIGEDIEVSLVVKNESGEVVDDSVYDEFEISYELNRVDFMRTQFRNTRKSVQLSIHEDYSIDYLPSSVIFKVVRKLNSDVMYTRTVSIVSLFG